MCKDELEKERKDWEIIYSIMEVYQFFYKKKILKLIIFKEIYPTLI